MTRRKNQKSWAINRLCAKAKLAAGLAGLVLAGFSPPGRTQTVPPDATVVRQMATQNPAPLPQGGFFGTDYEFLNQGRSGQELTLVYINPSANRKTAEYSLFSWPRTRLFAQIEGHEINRRNAMFGSTELTLANAQMSAGENNRYFRPLLEIPFGGYEIPIFLYVPNPRPYQPSW